MKPLTSGMRGEPYIRECAAKGLPALGNATGASWVVTVAAIFAELDALRARLATVERETVERCAKECDALADKCADAMVGAEGHEAFDRANSKAADCYATAAAAFRALLPPATGEVPK